MPTKTTRRPLFGRQIVLLAVAMGLGIGAHASDPFMKPTAEELAMTSLPGYPGAAAVVLYREQVDRDDLHVSQHYQRVKILTEDGKRYANVEIGFVRTGDSGDYAYSNGNGQTVGDILGRTIHADGTIIPFTGKPYLKTIEKAGNAKYQAMVFTLPDVEVGSIIEYRYAERYNDHIYESPSWYIQGELFVRSAHYQWFPTTHTLVDSQDRAINSISWFKVLPPGATIDHHQLPGNDTIRLPQETYDLLVKDVPPAVHEEYMPPLGSFSYRVLFNFTSYRSGEEFWKSEGKAWSHRSDGFMAESEPLRSATQGIVAGATTPDEKLRKIYAAVMTLENTHYTRVHEQREDQADGGKVNNVADVLAHKRGSATQLTELFVAMARAAGLKAYLMVVPNRSETIFTAGWLNFNQFDDSIAVVNVDGKDQFFDPGARYCPYGHLIWQHTFVQGLRQVEGGTAFAQTTGDGYKFNSTARVANLTMDENGLITGKVDLKFTGAQALRWRQAALRGDEESVKRGLRVDLENMLPKSLEVRVSDIQGLEDYEKQLAVSYSVRGTMGTPTGKRLVMPVDLFVSGETAVFSHEKRETSVYLQYPRILQDALRVVVPKGFEVEAAPTSSKFTMAERAGYTMNVTTTPNSFTTRRDYVLGDFLFAASDYAQLRTFYSQFQSKDQESVVLKAAPAQAAASGGN